MKLRLVAGVLLLLVAVGLPLAAMSGDGPPWGFRGHAAVIIEVTGTVEGTASELRQQKMGALDDKLDIAPNARLDVGDELRVARLSQAHLRTPAADVVVGDSARLLMSAAGIRIVRGVVEVTMRDGARSFPIDLDSGGSILVRGVAARAHVLADGKGGASAWVTDGSLEARTARGEILVEPGRMLVMQGDEAKVADRPSGVTVTATCGSAKLNIVAPARTQVFAAGTLGYPDVSAGAETGSVVFDVEPTVSTVAVLVRDVFGQLGRTTANCDRRK